MEENKDYQSSMEYSYGGGNATVQAPVKEKSFWVQWVPWQEH